ncbi:hypothetical protein BKA18_006415 [Streptomyces auratus]
MAPAVEGYARERQAATRGPRPDPVPTPRHDLTMSQQPVYRCPLRHAPPKRARQAPHDFRLRGLRLAAGTPLLTRRAAPPPGPYRQPVRALGAPELLTPALLTRT